MAFAVLSLVGLAAGSRALRDDGQAKGFALVAPSADIVRASPRLAVTLTEPEEVVAVPSVTAVRAAIAANPVPARVAARKLRDDATASLVARPASRVDDRALFEDRK